MIHAHMFEEMNLFVDVVDDDGGGGDQHIALPPLFDLLLFQGICQECCHLCNDR